MDATLILALVQARLDNDDKAFFNVVMTEAERQAVAGNDVLARELREMVAEARAKAGRSAKGAVTGSPANAVGKEAGDGILYYFAYSAQAADSNSQNLGSIIVKMKRPISNSKDLDQVIDYIREDCEKNRAGKYFVHISFFHRFE
jgi:hypothetical protein